MNLTKKEDIIKDGTEVLTSCGSKTFVAKVCGNDSETCDLSANKEYIDLNYYIVQNGKTFDDEHMCLDDEFTILGSKKVCPNCGEEIQEDLTLNNDELGYHYVCPKCESSADIEMFYEYQDK